MQDSEEAGPLQYGQAKVATGIPGAELLSLYEDLHGTVQENAEAAAAAEGEAGAAAGSAGVWDGWESASEDSDDNR